MRCARAYGGVVTRFHKIRGSGDTDTSREVRIIHRSFSTYSISSSQNSTILKYYQKRDFILDSRVHGEAHIPARLCHAQRALCSSCAWVSLPAAPRLEAALCVSVESVCRCHSSPAGQKYKQPLCTRPQSALSPPLRLTPSPPLCHSLSPSSSSASQPLHQRLP